MKTIEVYGDGKMTIGFVETDKNILDARKLVMQYFPNCASMDPKGTYLPKYHPRCKEIAKGIFSWE
jgi:hypothetical protein